MTCICSEQRYSFMIDMSDICDISDTVSLHHKLSVIVCIYMQQWNMDKQLWISAMGITPFL